MPNKESIIPLKKEYLSPEKSHSFALTAWKVLKPFINHEISNSSQNNLEILNQTLLHTSVILVGYHPHILDGFFVPIALRSHLPNLKHLIGPIAAAQHHKPYVKAWETVSANLLTTHFMPTVRLNNPKDDKYQQHANIYGNSLHHHTKEKLSSPGSIYGITPGGTRKEILQDPQDLNHSYVRRVINPKGNIPYVPLTGFMYDEKYQVKVGKSLYLTDAPMIEGSRSEIAEHHSTWIMKHLAGLLPEEFRGPYTPIFSE